MNLPGAIQEILSHADNALRIVALEYEKKVIELTNEVTKLQIQVNAFELKEAERKESKLLKKQQKRERSKQRKEQERLQRTLAEQEHEKDSEELAQRKMAEEQASEEQEEEDDDKEEEKERHATADDGTEKKVVQKSDPEDLQPDSEATKSGPSRKNATSNKKKRQRTENKARISQNNTEKTKTGNNNDDKDEEEEEQEDLPKKSKKKLKRIGNLEPGYYATQADLSEADQQCAINKFKAWLQESLSPAQIAVVEKNYVNIQSGSHYRVVILDGPDKGQELKNKSKIIEYFTSQNEPLLSSQPSPITFKNYKEKDDDGQDDEDKNGAAAREPQEAQHKIAKPPRISDLVKPSKRFKGKYVLAKTPLKARTFEKRKPPPK